MVEGWDKYKDLEYYPDKVCKCGCSGKIKVQSHHKYYKIPEFILGHNARAKRDKPRGVDSPNWIPREIRICACGCKETFECRVNSIQRYLQGHTGGRKKFSREMRICFCGCGEAFECRVDSNRTYYSYRCYWRDMKGKVSPLKGKTWEEYYGEEKARALKQNLSVKCSGMTGSKASNWQGGISLLPYSFEFNKEFKNFIRERDNSTCQLCSRTKEKDGKNLCVHHIGYDKENSCSDEYDFITLCRGCNNKVNFNREYWTKFFQLMQEKRFCLAVVV